MRAALSRSTITELIRVSQASVDAGSTIVADGATIEAGMLDVSGNSQNEYETSATAGAGAKTVGVAGGLGLTIVTTDTRATLAGTATMTDGGALTISATEDSSDKAAAQPKKVSGASLGIGASVAWVVATHNVTAEVADGATLSGNDVTVTAKLNLEVDATAESGVGGEDGSGGKLAFTPVAAVALVDSATKARVGTGVLTTITGKLDVLSDYASRIETHAKGATTGSSLAIGASVALTIADENTSASLERSFSAGGDITVQAASITDDSASAIASAVGAAEDITGAGALLAFAGMVSAQAPLFECLIEPNQVVEIRSPVEGLIEKIHVKRGDRVTAGQVLVQLESNAEQSAAEMARYRSQMAGRIATAKNRLDYAMKKAERSEDLHKKSFVTSQARDEAEAERRIAESELKDAIENQELAKHDHRHSVNLMNRRTLRSPFTGVVVDRMLNPGDLAEAGTGRKGILKLAEVEPLRVEVVLPIEAHGKLKIGASADVIPEGVGGRHAAKVTVVDTVLDSASATFGVRLQMPNPKNSLPAGIRCKVEFPELKSIAVTPRSRGVRSRQHACIAKSIRSFRLGGAGQHERAGRRR